MTNEKLISEARRLENDYGDSYEVMTHMSALADALEASEERVKELEAQVKDFKCEQIFRISEMQELLEAQQRISELEAKLAARQPSEDGEYILRLIETIKQTGGSVEVAGVKIMPCDEFGRTAAVPDAATERVTKNSVRHVKRLTTELQNKREALNDQRREYRVLLSKRDRTIDGLRAERDAALAAVERVRVIHRETGAGGDCAVCIEWGWPCPTVVALDGAPEPEEVEAAAKAETAPQAESATKSNYISPHLPAQIRGLYRADLREKSIQTMLDLAGDLVQELIDLRAATVLPSGGVDEVALAEVRKRLDEAGDSVAWAHGDEWSPKARKAHNDLRAAVAEWLKGQGR